MTAVITMRNDRAALWFVVPEQMYETPLDEDPRRLGEQAYESLLKARPDLTPAQCWDTVSTEEQTLATLVREGAVYVGTFLARSEADPTELATARFCILIKAAVLPHDRPFDVIADQLAALDEPREITLDEFPAGPALFVEEDTPSSSARQGRFAQVLLPSPDRQWIVTLRLSAEDISDWVYLRGLLETVARTVSFTGPEAGR